MRDERLISKSKANILFYHILEPDLLEHASV